MKELARVELIYLSRLLLYTSSKEDISSIQEEYNVVFPKTIENKRIVL